MGYKILIDSCGEIPQSLMSTGVVENIPLSIMVEDETIIDDETFDQKSFLEKVAKSKNCPKSACPSPEGYMKAFECEADRIYVVTLSSKLSGSYNSLAKISMKKNTATNRLLYLILNRHQSVRP